MRTARDPLAVECPKCGRPPGWMCGTFTPAGVFVFPPKPHEERVRAAEREKEENRG